MTWREAEKLLKTLLPRLPADLSVSKRLLFVHPVNPILRGFYLDRSIDPAAFYLQVFVQPLYLPQDTFVFNFGKRLGTGWRYEAGHEEALSEQLLQAVYGELSVLRTLATPTQFAEDINRFTNSSSVHLLRARAYSLVLAGNHKAAVEVFDKLHDTIISFNNDRAWVLERLRRDDALRQLLVEDPAAVEAKLWAWERQTLANLRLEKFATGH